MGVGSGVGLGVGSGVGWGLGWGWVRVQGWAPRGAYCPYYLDTNFNHALAQASGKCALLAYLWIYYLVPKVMRLFKILNILTVVQFLLIAIELLSALESVPLEVDPDVVNCN